MPLWAGGENELISNATLSPPESLQSENGQRPEYVRDITIIVQVKRLSRLRHTCDLE